MGCTGLWLLSLLTMPLQMHKKPPVTAPKGRDWIFHWIKRRATG